MIGTYILVKGKVQGVCFRYYTEKTAKKLGLKGTVQNLPTGEVKIIVQGNSPAVKELENWCWQGSPHSVVTEVICQRIELQEPLPLFRIEY